MDRARTAIDNPRVAALIDRERRRFDKSHPRARDAAVRGRALGLHAAAGGFAPFIAVAKGIRLRDIDGCDYLDFRLGGGVALSGHGGEAVAAAVTRQLARGAATGLPTEDAIFVAEELARRFALPLWTLTASAADALRAAVRIARELTGRDKVLLFEGGGHGRLAEIASPAPRVVAFNDLDALREALAARDVACVLTEPAMTRAGLAPPAAGYHGALKAAAREAGTLVVYDEAQTIACGIGGYSREHKLEPDLVTLGGALAGGLPAGALGLSRETAEQLQGADPSPGSRAGAVAAAAMRAVLTDVLTETAYRGMIGRASALASGVYETIKRHGLSWSVTKIGARCGLLFAPTPPRNGADCAAARQEALEAWLDLYCLNEGLLASASPPTWLTCPATSEADVARHTQVFAGFVETAIAEGAIAP